MHFFSKPTAAVLTFCLMFFLVVVPVEAAPANSQKGNNNPQVVSYWPDASHTVIQPDGSIKYDQTGDDLVLEAGSQKTFQQWFDADNGSSVHTVWRNVGDDTSCANGWTWIENPHQPPVGDTWGDHFPDGDNYCVKSNFYAIP